MSDDEAGIDAVSVVLDRRVELCSMLADSVSADDDSVVEKVARVDARVDTNEPDIDTRPDEVAVPLDSKNEEITICEGVIVPWPWLRRVEVD